MSTVDHTDDPVYEWHIDVGGRVETWTAQHTWLNEGVLILGHADDDGYAFQPIAQYSRGAWVRCTRGAEIPT
jgi:hypothetical protein